LRACPSQLAELPLKSDRDNATNHSFQFNLICTTSALFTQTPVRGHLLPSCYVALDLQKFAHDKPQPTIFKPLCYLTTRAQRDFPPSNSAAFPSIYTFFSFFLSYTIWDAFDSSKNRKRQSVTAKREKSQTPKFVTAK